MISSAKHLSKAVDQDAPFEGTTSSLHNTSIRSVASCSVFTVAACVAILVADTAACADVGGELAFEEAGLAVAAVVEVEAFALDKPIAELKDRFALSPSCPTTPFFLPSPLVCVADTETEASADARREPAMLLFRESVEAIISSFSAT